MSELFLNRLKELLETVWGAEPNFYRTKYLCVGIDERFIADLDEARFKTLPHLTKEELARAPYASRLYHEASGMNKLIPCVEAGRHFLIHRTLEEIREENLPYEGTRPMVLVGDMYEAIERCLFLYEQNILPLIGEFRNPAVVEASARQYHIDSLVIDHAAIERYRARLLSFNLRLKSVTMVDSALHWDDFSGWPQETKKYFVLNIPEAGRIAYLCPEAPVGKTPVVHPYDDTFVESGAFSTITSTRLKACPVIRYRLPLYLEAARSTCDCGRESFLL